MTQTGTLTRTVLLVLLGLLAIPLVMMLVMMPMMGAFGWSHMHSWMWDSSSGWLVMILMISVPLLVVVAIGYIVYRSLAAADGDGDQAIKELRHAYARGDISDEEFEKKRKQLKQDNSVSR